MIRLHLDRSLGQSLMEQAREQIVSALHLGTARPGERLPSVRALSRACGIDPKTAFRLYHALAEDGYVALRPGSGAYVTEAAAGLIDQARALALLRLVRKHVIMAGSLDLTPQRYAELVVRYTAGRPGTTASPERIAFIECNREQVDVISQELARRIGVIALPILISSLLDRNRRALADAGGARYLVTTDYHLDEVEPIAEALGKRLLCVRLDPQFLERLLQLASRGTLGMIVSDTSFLPRFRRSIVKSGLDPRATRRIEAVAGTDLERVRELIVHSDALYVSPLCAAAVKRLVPRAMPVLQPRAHLSTESIESIEAMLLFGDRAAAPRVP